VLSFRLLSFRIAVVRACSASRPTTRLRRARAATCVACTDCGLLPDPRARACRRSRSTPGPQNGPDDGEEGRTRPALRSAACPAAGSRFADAHARNHGHREPEYL